MRVLVTGGAGYVGTRLSNALVRVGHSVRVVDALLHGSQGLHPDIELRRGDLRDRSDAARALTGVDVVFHLASNASRTTEGAPTPRAVDLGAFLHEARKRRVRRLVYASPLESQDASEARVARCLVEENAPGFETTVVRMAPICGPSPRQRFDLGANAMAGSAWFEGRIELTNGETNRPHLAMSDAIRLFMKLLEAPAANIAGRTFDAGYECMTPRELAELVRGCVPTPNGVPATIEIAATDAPRAVGFDPLALEAALDFRPESSVREMVDQLALLLEQGFLDRDGRGLQHEERARPIVTEPSRGWRLIRRAARARDFVAAR